MKAFCTAVLSLSMTLSSALVAHAQLVAADSDDLARCADWVKKTVPANFRVIGSDFCRGIKREGSPDGWYSIQNCGDQSGGDKVPVKRFCSSSGAVGPDWTVAAGYIGTGPDGSELINGTDEGRTPHSATLYSRTPIYIGDTRIPAGFSQLMLMHADRGWQMSIVPEKEKATRTVQLLSDARQLSATGNELAISVHYASPRCSDFPNVRELAFTYAGTDLYVCMRPDRFPPISDESAAIQ